MDDPEIIAAMKAKKKAYLAAWRVANADRIRAYSAAYYARDPEAMRAKAKRYIEENPEKARAAAAVSRAKRVSEARAYSAAYRAAHPEQVKAAVAKWYTNNKDRARKQATLYRKANREKIKAREKEKRPKYRQQHAVYQANRRARVRGSEGSYTPEDIADLLKKQRHRCVNCKASLKQSYHIDHIMPLARGGSNDRHNVQLLCPTCNMRKKAKHPIEFALENGRLV